MGALTRAVRNVSRRKVRTLLVIIALGFCMAIMISIPAGIVANQQATMSLSENYANMISSMEEEINKTSTLIECRTSPGGQPFTRQGTPSGGPTTVGPGQQEVYINQTIVDEIKSIDGVKDGVEFLEHSSEDTTSQTITSPRGDEFTISRPVYTITGVDLNATLTDEYSILPTNITAGRNLAEGDSNVVLATANLTEYYGVELGQYLEINGEYFKIVGIYEAASQGFTGSRGVYMNITDIQTITDQTGNVSRLDVYAVDDSAVDGIAEVIEASYSDLYVTTYSDRLENLQNMQDMNEQMLTNAESTVSQTQAVATQEIIVSVAATSLIVLFLMLYTVRERTKEIGTLKAIGFSNWNVMTQFMLEGVLISLAAGVVGVAIGIVGAPSLSSLLLPHVSLFSSSQTGRQFVFNPASTPGAAVSTAVASLDLQLVFLAFGAAIVLGALGSIYPAWRAARIRPAEAMRYE